MDGLGETICHEEKVHYKQLSFQIKYNSITLTLNNKSDCAGVHANAVVTHTRVVTRVTISSGIDGECLCYLIQVEWKGTR